MNNDIMLECINRAELARGLTLSNPLVGACVVSKGEKYFGIHEYFGGSHAEINALSLAGDKAKDAELYVTLEPCSTFSKTPPCVNAIIAAGIKKVYIGVVDPNPLNSHSGIEALKQAGVEVEVGVESKKCALLIEDFIKFNAEKQPYVTAKIAMSADGKVATSLNDSKWITSIQSREIAHKMRTETDVVLVGIGTVILDDPMLNVRLCKKSKNPMRVVLDTFARIPITSKLVQSAKDVPLIIYVSDRANKSKIKELEDYNVKVEVVDELNKKINLTSMLSSLYSKGFMNVLVEGGSTVTGAFNDNKLIDKLELFIAPKIIGGVGALPSIAGVGINYMSDACEFASFDCEKLDVDIKVTARLKDYTYKVL